MTKLIHDSEVPWCTPKAKPWEIYKIRVRDLAPTQFAVGRAEVAVRAGRLKKKYKKVPRKMVALHDYLRVRPIPVVIRNDSFYLVDHHHLVRTLYDALHKEEGSKLCAFVEVLANGSTLERVYFWKQMHKRNWVYLFDRDGAGPQQPERLPSHIKDLAFDPYRSLAWIVRDHHGYLKNDAPFSEFKWASFFRTRILLDQDILAGKHTFDDFAFDVDAKGQSKKPCSWRRARRQGVCLGSGGRRRDGGVGAAILGPGRSCPSKFRARAVGAATLHEEPTHDWGISRWRKSTHRPGAR